MFSGLKSQLDLSDSYLKDMIPLEHELVKLKNIINWKEINSIYEKCFNSRKGNKTKRTEIAIGLIILRRYYSKSYRETIKEFHVNNAYMYFCNVSNFEIIEYNKRNKTIIDHSTLVKILKRLGEKNIKKIEKSLLKKLIKNKIINGRHVYSDTTSCESNIIYPTEINLLNRVIENAEKVVQKILLKKDLAKTEAIRKAKQISKIFYSSTNKSKELLKNCSKKLIEIAETAIKKAAESLNEVSDVILKTELTSIYEKVERVGEKIIEQIKLKERGEKIPDKIVSYYEEHARALPKGKVNKPCEFGVKVRIDQSENNYITNYEIYEGNPNESGMLEDVIDKHDKIFHEEFEGGAMDRGYFDEKKKLELEEKYNIVLAIPHKKDRNKKMGRKEKKIYDKRSAIEAKISEGKRTAGLGKSYDKGIEKHKIWISLSVFILNARHLIRDMSKNKELALKLMNS